jgi:uncharacterized protein (TIGR03435 family)
MVSMSTHPDRRLWFPLGLMPLLAATMATASFGQTAASHPTPATQTAAAMPVFDVAAIKLNKSGDGGSSSNSQDGRFTATNVTLKSLMQFDAYGIPAPRILGGPKWVDTTRFDVEAKMDEADAAQLKALDRAKNSEQTHAMFQQLLADRFKLAVHWETRELPIYALVVAKNGPKFLPTKELNGGSGTSSNSNQTSRQLKVTNQTVQELAEALTQDMSEELGRNVIDKTGIEGKYDFALKWTPQTDASPVADTGAPDSGPSLFTAIQEQLGLKLESAKGPVQVLVIDHAEMPSEN